jgi:hypothetical protein
MILYIIMIFIILIFVVIIVFSISDINLSNIVILLFLHRQTTNVCKKLQNKFINTILNLSWFLSITMEGVRCFSEYFEHFHNYTYFQKKNKLFQPFPRIWLISENLKKVRWRQLAAIAWPDRNEVVAVKKTAKMNWKIPQNVLLVNSQQCSCCCDIFIVVYDYQLKEIRLILSRKNKKKIYKWCCQEYYFVSDKNLICI